MQVVGQLKDSCSPLATHLRSLLISLFVWVAVKELKLSHHNGYIYIVNNRVSPI